MFKVQDLVVRYLDQARQMQIATCSGNQPWAATVFFAHDNLNNLYWVSKPDARHSQEIANNPRVAGAISLEHSDTNPARGLQFQGNARQVTDPDEIRHLFLAYGERYNALNQVEDIISGKNPYHLYEAKPELFVLYDEENFPTNPRQEWDLRISP